MSSGRGKDRARLITKSPTKFCRRDFSRTPKTLAPSASAMWCRRLAPNATTVQIDAVFVDARGVKHPSLGNVESSEYAAIQQHLKTIQDNQRQAVEAKVANAGSAAPMPSSLDASPATPSAPAPDSSTAGLTVPELQKRVNSLRHEVELRVKESGAPLKSAPYQGAATLESLPGAAEVVVEILTPYWYGVETGEWTSTAGFTTASWSPCRDLFVPVHGFANSR